MENRTNYKKYFLQYVAPIIISLVITLFFNILVEYSKFEDGIITISDSAKQEDSYISVISIHNFDSKTLEQIALYFKEECKIINVLDNSYASASGNYLNFVNVPPKEEISLAVITSQKILPQSIVCESSYKINIDFQDKENLKIISLLTRVLPSVLLYSCFFILDSRNNAKTLLKIKNEKADSEEKLMECKEALNNVNKKINEYTKKIEKLYYNLNKKEIFYQARIRDIKKELNFWRDTIRKILYNSTKEQQDADMIIDLITTNLKTYTTRENVEKSFDEALFLAQLIAKEEKEEK